METLTQITNYLASQSWQIALLSVAVAAVSLLLKNRSSHVRYLLWLVVLAKCLVPSLFTITLAVLPQPMSTEDAPPAATTPVFEAPEIKSAVLGPAVFHAPALPESELTPIYSTSTPVPPVSEPTVTDKLAKVSARQWLALGWAVGAALFMAVVSIKALRTNLWLKARRRALPAKLQGPIADFFAELGVRRAPKVWMVAGIGQPFVWGLLRGAIYLPTDFKSNARRSHRQVLAHELSHVLRFDAAVNLLQIIAQAFYWFHPFVWWANKKIRAEREKSCDETAIARLNVVPKDYSRAIVNILVTEHNSARPVPSLAIAGPIRNIEDRIKTIMQTGKKFYRRPSIITVVVVAILAAVAVPTTLALTSIPVPEPSAPGTEAAGKAIEQITDAQKIRLDVGVTRAEATVAEPGDEIARNVYENFLFLRRDDTVVLALVGEDGFDLTDIWRNKGLHVMGWEPLAAVRGKLYGIRWAANQLLEIDLASGQCGIVTNSFAPYYYHPQSGRLYSTKKLANGYRLVVYDLVKGIWRDIMESPFREEMVRFTHIAVSLDERFVAFPEPIAEELEGFSKVKDVVLVDSNGTQSGLRGTFPLFPPLFRLVFADLESGRVTRLPWEFVYAPSGGYSGIDAFPIGRGISIHRRPNQIAWYDSKTVLVVRMDNPVNGRPRVGLAAFDIETGQMQNVAALPMISTLNLMGSITQQGDEDVRLVGTASAVPNTYRVDLKAGPLIEDNSTASIGGAFRCEGGNILWGDKAIEGSKGASSVVVSPDGRRILWRRAPSRKGKDRYDVLCWDSVKGGVAVVAAENAREGVGLMWVGKSDLVKAETSEPPMPWQRITATPWPKPEPRGPDKRPKVTDLLSMELKTGANWGEAVRTEDIDATVRDVLYETYDMGTTMWSPMTRRLFAERFLELMQKQAPAQKLFAIAASGTDAQKKALLESVKRMCEVYLNKLPDFESDPDVPWRATVVHSPGVMVYPPLLLQLEDDPAQTLDIVTRMYLRGQDARAKFRRARGAREHIGWGTSDTGTIMAYVCDSCMTRLDSEPRFNNQATAGQLRALQEYEDYRAKTARWDPADDEITVMKFAARICNSHADPDANWGQPVAGLRCRWVTPAKKVQAGSAVVIGMEVENISGGRIFWQCRQGTWNICTPGSEPKDGSSTAPQFQIRPADGVRAATDEEAQMHHEGAGSAIGYYCLEPGARMTITAPYLWPLVESGRVEVNAFLWRVNPGGGGAYPMDHVHKNRMTCPPLVLEVVGGVDRQIIEGLSVWVSCDEARVELAEDLKFTVRVENKSGREVELDSCGLAEDFPDLTLRMDSQESGRHILSTKKAGGRGPRRARRTIKNNVKKVREIRLSQLWRGYGGRPILSPGRYRVIANVGALTEQGGQIEVASAPIWVTISQWPWGKQVNGLQCSAVPEKVMWEAGETPTLEAKVRNVGSSPWLLPSLLELFYLKTGGKLWHWRPDVSAELVNLEPGEGLEKTIRVTEDWVCSDDPNLRLKLSPGRHTIQFVILVAEPTEANVPPGTSQMPRPLTIESNPIQIEILPAEREAKEADEVDWGQAVEGVQCRLRPDRDSWRAGETATLKADIRNRGTHQLSVVQHQGLCELWFDGRWYRWEGEIRAKSSPLGPGRQYNDVPISLDEHWVANRNGKPLRPRRRHTVRVAFITDSKQGEVIRVHSNPVLIEILPPRPGSGSSSRGAEREAEARRAVAEGSRRRISYIGLDLTDAPRTSNRADLADLFEERPRGSGTYLLRDEVVAARHPEFWEEGVVYYVAEKKQFYIIEEPGHPGSGSKTFYGPFAGEPWKRFGMAEPRPVKKQYRFAIYLVVDPIDVGHPEDVTLEQLRLGSVPALTEEDIVEYDWNEHFLKLTPEAWKRVPSPRSVWGLPFVVVADGQRCYLGAFSSFGSSYMPKVPFIGGFRPGWRENKIQISHPDPIAGAKDPRNDLRIRKVLEELKIVGATKERLKSADKLKGLGLALLMFANDHQGNYPDALQELAQKDYIDEQDLKWFLENVEYLGKATTGAGASGKVIAYDRMLLKRKHGSFTNVLLLDGHVALKDSEQLYKLGIWCFVIPDEVKAVMLQFVEAVQEAFWEQAYPGKEDLLWERVLVNCSERVKAKAKEYESARAFFRDVVPLRAVAESRELRFFPDKGSSDRFYYVSNWFFRTSDPNMEHRTGWQPSILKTEAGWIIDFRTTPLKEWIERYKEQAIRARLSEDEREAKWHAFEWKLKRVKARTRLVPVSREFVIGRPMLFRLELINEGEEEFLYDHQQIAVNRSLTITNESGERMPYITGPVQTWPADGYKRIKPGESVVLFDSLDIANEYDIRKVGKYKVQFNGRGLHTAINIGEGEKAPFDNDNILGLRRTFPSNIVETEVTFLERDRKKKSTIGQDASVSKQLEQVVDLSVLRPDMTFAEALGHLKNSVKPPLVIVVLWRDVEDNADVHRITPINMDPISAVQLGAALELLLRSVSGREAELDYVVNDGVIVIATKESLPRKMETRVYDISALIGVRSKGGYRRQYYGTGQSYGGGSLGYMAGEYVHLPGGWGAMRRSDFNKLSNVHRAGELPADMPSRYVSLTFTPSVKQDSGDISLALTVAFDKVVGHKNYVIETPLPGGAVAEQKQGLPRTKEIWRLRTCQTVPEGKILLVKGREFETQNKAGEVITKDLFILIEPEELDPIRTEELFC